MGVPPTRPADRALARPRRRPLAAVVALAALLAVGAGVLVDLATPAPRPASAPAGEFSAQRAYENVKVIAARPHVAGSAANDQVREHLVGVLRGLGLKTEVQDAVAPEAGQLSGAAGGATLARVRNVVARLPGTDSTGRVFLVAHYDSVQSGPGGNDDAAGTASILEVARALTAGPRPRNDIVLVLTDAEEACLCGASGFAADHPLARDGGVVLNLEARGSTGPVIMFETSRNNAKLVDVFGRAAPHPVGTSFAVEIYRALPNDTDFTAFLDHGFVGLNSAYIDGGAVYHTPLDTPATMDRGSLQMHGDNALGLAREFGRTDLRDLSSGHDATYFPVPGGLVRYPGWLTLPLALLALVAVGALGWLLRRRGRATAGRLAAGFGLALAPIVVAPLGAWLLWTAITTIRPGYAELLDPYRPVWYRLAVVALAAAVLFTWYALTRRRVGPAALAFGGLAWLALFGVLLAVLVPGGAYLATLPALAGALAGLVALRTRLDGPWPVVAVTLAGAVAVTILLPTVVLLFPALGMAMGGVAALFAVLLGLAALPVVDLLHPQAGGQRGLVALRARRLGAVPALAAALAAVVLAGVGLAVDRFDATHPVPTHLMYALDADTGKAQWLSHEGDPQPWTDGYVDGETAVRESFPGLGDGELRAGPAPAASLPAPKVELLSDTRSGQERILRLRLVPQRVVRMTSLHVDSATAVIKAATVGGRDVPVKTLGARWGFGIVFHAPPPEGVEVTLTLTSNVERVRFRAMDASDGLDQLPGFRPRPPDVGVVGSHTSEMLAVARTYEF
ncbi:MULTISPECIES: M28 family peptidase [Micromonospora]|uniref:M28 family peptidase n=1 Tax=Micromonospora solifontis TaxID=2487138 RepID=A0ABX9WJC2_9ACTN|nr:MULTISPECIES: M28 family peptidase [Micromonospora]NES12514.1 M28 family peptidase [Micromonospora sp. PPF5-17B]NES36041.1 M28 family peptidase [Micromonospora solifontis]NES54601.1 M28 family peptidase [Micromonospora sp. PPF5-6]RNL99963.1 M28 family peptidase [Micromonospora solifontis]